MEEKNVFDFVAFLSGLGCGLVAGVFFAFSTFVMKALAKLPPAQGLAAMQSINEVVINPWFLTLFLGTAVTSACMVIGSLLRWHDPRAFYWLAGGALYLAGTILVTAVCNVPRNDALAQVAPGSPEAAGFWATYLSIWTAWNHVRTVAALLAGVSFTVALRFRP
jgi:uncharacterized membrane protein